MKRKMKKKNDLPERGFEPHIFSNFPAHDLNFHVELEPEIKSKQASKRDRTLLKILQMYLHRIML